MRVIGKLLIPGKGLEKRFRHNVIGLLIKADDKGQLPMFYSFTLALAFISFASSKNV